MTEHPESPSSPPSRRVIVGGWFAGVAAIGGIFAMVLIAIDKVLTGQGLETYRTHWLVEFNWVGLLVFLIAVAVVLVIGLLFRLREWREIRKLQAKYADEANG